MGSKVTERRQRRRILAVALAVAAVTGMGYAATNAAGKSQAEPVTLTISLFGDFGYHDLYKQYEAAHPGVTIKESIQDFPIHHSNLAKSVATNAGAADVEAIEVGFIAQFKAQPTAVREPAPVRCGSAEGPVAAVEVGAGTRQQG